MPETVGDVQRGELDVNSIELRDATRDETETDNMHPCKQLLLVWKELVVILTPNVLLPIPILWPDGVSIFAINERYFRLQLRILNNRFTSLIVGSHYFLIGLRYFNITSFFCI